MNINDNIMENINDKFIDSENKLKERSKWDTYSYNNIPIPRVSYILSSGISNDSLMWWSNSLGFKHIAYKDMLNLAAERGNVIHKAIEDYILDNKIPDYRSFPDDIEISLFNAFKGFKSWWDHFIKDNKVKVLAVEKELVCPYYGGTLDLLLEVNGKVYIYDFKTSNNLQYKHYIQLSAYKYCMENYYGTNIDGVSILLLNKSEQKCTDNLLLFSIDTNRIFIENCTNYFFSLLYSYYYRLQVEQDFKNILPKRK